jgi:uncharacterized membrane protein
MSPIRDEIFRAIHKNGQRLIHLLRKMLLKYFLNFLALLSFYQVKHSVKFKELDVNQNVCHKHHSFEKYEL